MAINSNEVSKMTKDEFLEIVSAEISCAIGTAWLWLSQNIDDRMELDAKEDAMNSIIEDTIDKVYELLGRS